MIHVPLLIFIGICAAGQSIPTLDVPYCKGPVTVDAKLDETCYAQHKPATAFVVAAQAKKKAPDSKAWLFWNENEFIFAFECIDETIVAKAPSDNEKDVDPQDRAEIFLWSGDPNGEYYCMEVAPDGAVHDYAARFYRKMNDSWAVPGWKFATARTRTGYIIEAAVSRDAMEKCGFKLAEGYKLRGGLFRADYKSSNPDAEPDWITWVESGKPQADFHIAESFGWFRLGK